ncbi:hypothetical protein KUTeg_010915 [Tegillarca granosa]|uniref:Multiple epidermal growth factor-like domains protein 10 n=1 Tax=Tegillarca granosa TaxID=220873 RepID=A0ABQ9F5N2_TEGGR|nr:hypothetical protein KUTeg_010915 [Tegillarca granosa]
MYCFSINGFVWILFIFPVVLSLNGGEPNVCKKDVTFMVTKRESYNQPYQKCTRTWCLSFIDFFRCTRCYHLYRIGYRMHYSRGVRTEYYCCSGYVNSGNKCVPYCPDGCRHACEKNWYGKDCSIECNCNNGGCNPVNGTCYCDPGWVGQTCDTPCEQGKYGPNCVLNCRCMNGALCDPVDGACSCQPGYMGPLMAPLVIQQTGRVHVPAGWTGEICTEECPWNKYGVNCEQDCICYNGVCNSKTGQCSCVPGYYGYSCETDCPAGTFGKNCTQKCSCLNDGTCSHIDGKCSCPIGYSGDNCEVRDRYLYISSDIDLSFSFCDQYNYIISPLYFSNLFNCHEDRYGYNCGNICQCKKDNTLDVSNKCFHERKCSHILVSSRRSRCHHVLSCVPYKSFLSKFDSVLIKWCHNRKSFLSKCFIRSVLINKCHHVRVDVIMFIPVFHHKSFLSKCFIRSVLINWCHHGILSLSRCHSVLINWCHHVRIGVILFCYVVQHKSFCLCFITSVLIIWCYNVRVSIIMFFHVLHHKSFLLVFITTVLINWYHHVRRKNYHCLYAIAYEVLNTIHVYKNKQGHMFGILVIRFKLLDRHLYTCPVVLLDCNAGTGECTCKPGWTGVRCDTACQAPFYGEKCMKICDCLNGGMCHHVTGECQCPAGYQGVSNKHLLFALLVINTPVVCFISWTGLDCNSPCSNYTFGMNCTEKCKCQNGAYCNFVTGTCTCASGYTGDICADKCPTKSFYHNNNNKRVKFQIQMQNTIKLKEKNATAKQ